MNRRRSHRTRNVALVLVALSLIVVAFALARRKSRPGSIEILTATEGGTYHALGSKLAIILKSASEFKNATARTTGGSAKNGQILLDPAEVGKHQIAFVMARTLHKISQNSPEDRERLSILARLYSDTLQVIIRTDAFKDDSGETENITKLEQLKGRKEEWKPFLGPRGSSTREVARDILRLGYREALDRQVHNIDSWQDAAQALKDKRIDVAFVMAGTPTNAVRDALEDGEDGKDRSCRLVSVVVKNLDQKPGLESATIPARVYPGQEKEIETLGSQVYLVCRKDLPTHRARAVLESLFDNIVDLSHEHSKAEDVKLGEAFKPLGDLEYDFHPGAVEFQAREERKILIATGPINGKYYQLGRTLQTLLNEANIPARVVHTDGSFENARMLRNHRTISFVQFDVALACRSGMATAVYGRDFSDKYMFDDMHLDIRRLAVLHDEIIYVIARREKLVELGLEELDGEREKATAQVPDSRQSDLAPRFLTLGDVVKKADAKKVPLLTALGPELSGTRIVAQAVIDALEHKEWLVPDYMSVPEMGERLRKKEIDVGFFVSYQPSPLFTALLNDDRFRLLSLDPGIQARLVAMPAFQTSKIEEEKRFRCQRPGEGEIHTIQTQALLVTTQELSENYDVRRVTEAILGGSVFLEIDMEGLKTKESKLQAIPLHPDAKRAYQARNLLPTEPQFSFFDFVNVAWKVLAIFVILFVILFGAYKGLIKLRRDNTANELGRRILTVNVEQSDPVSVRQLQELRREIEERVRRRWWKFGELDKPRWRYLSELIENRVQVATNNMTLGLIGQVVRVAQDGDLSAEERRSTFDAMERRIKERFAAGEIIVSQREILLMVLHESRQGSRDESSTPDDAVRRLKKEIDKENTYLTEHPRAKPETALRRVEKLRQKLNLPESIKISVADGTLRVHA